MSKRYRCPSAEYRWSRAVSILPFAALAVGVVLAVDLMPSGIGLTALGATVVRTPSKKAYGKKTPSKPSGQPEPRDDWENCCPVGRAIGNRSSHVVLVRICNSRKGIVADFSYKGMHPCTYPPTTVLVDDRGRRYRMHKFVGIPNCFGDRNRKPVGHFSWFFAAAKGGVHWLSVIERDDPGGLSLKGWRWSKVDVSRCFR